MSDAPYSCLKCRVAGYRCNITPNGAERLLVARRQRCAGDNGDGLLVRDEIAHAGDLCANQQAGEKFADLLAREISQHVRGANLKKVRQNIRGSDPTFKPGSKCL